MNKNVIKLETLGLVTTEGAARILDCDPSHVRRLRMIGALPSVVGSQRVVLHRTKDVYAFLEAHGSPALRRAH